MLTNEGLRASAAIVVSAICFALPANENHSHACLNPDDVRLYGGVVTRYSWTMPHVFLKIDAPGESGKVFEYTVELLPYPMQITRPGAR